MNGRAVLAGIAVLGMLAGACTAGAAPTASNTRPGATSTTPRPATTAATSGLSGPPATSPAASGSPAGGPELADCEVFPHVHCGSIDVPLDRAHPNGPTIPISFFFLQHTDEPAAEPIFALPGGPGASGIDAMGFAMALGTLPAHHDIVAISPRGTGDSGAIDCPDLQDGWDSTRTMNVAVAACGRQLGDASDRYGSGDVALDIEAVRRAFGYGDIDLYGMSYGTVPEQAYVVRFPQHVHAVVFDAGLTVTDPDHVFGWDLGAPAEIVRAVALMCSREPACHVADPAGTLAWLIGKVGRTPPTGVVGQRKVTVDQVELANLFQMTGTCSVCGDLDPAEIVGAADRFRKGNPTPLLRIAADRPMYDFGAGDASQFSLGDNIAAQCNDQDFVWNRDDPIPVRQRKYRAALAAFRNANPFTPFSVGSWVTYLPEPCMDWPAPERFVPAIPAHASFPDVPTLILAGDADVVVPPVVVRTLRAEFPHAAFVVVAGAGHPVTGPAYGTCGAELVSELFDQLKITDTSCAKSPQT